MGICLVGATPQPQALLWLALQGTQPELLGRGLFVAASAAEQPPRPQRCSYRLFRFQGGWGPSFSLPAVRLTLCRAHGARRTLWLGARSGGIPGPSTAPSLCHPARIPPVPSAPQPLQPRTSVVCQSLAAGPGHHGNVHAPSSLGAACGLPRGPALGLPRPMEAVGPELPPGVPQPPRLPQFCSPLTSAPPYTAWLQQVSQQPQSKWAGSCGSGSGPGSRPGPPLPTPGCRTASKLMGSTAFECDRRLVFFKWWFFRQKN